jgi:hypothetical protein
MENLGKGMWFFQNTKGELLELPRIIEKVAELIGGMSRTDQAEVLGNLFGKDAADVWGTLLNLQLNNKDLVQQNKEEMKDYQGQAEETARVMNSTVSASFERLWGSITAIGDAQLMQETGPMQGWLDGITDRIERFDLNVWMEEHKDTIEHLGRSAEAAGILALALVDAFVKMHEALAPVLLPILERTADVLKVITDNGWLLEPIMWTLIGYFATMKILAAAAAIQNFILATSLVAVATAGKGAAGVPLPGPLGKGGTAGRAATMASRAGVYGLAVGVGAGIVATRHEITNALDMPGWSQIPGLVAPGFGPLVDAAMFGADRAGLLDRGRRGATTNRNIGPTRYGNITAPVPVSPMTGIPRISRDDFDSPSGGRGRTSDLRGIDNPIIVQIDGREVARAVARTTGDLGARR